MSGVQLAVAHGLEPPKPQAADHHRPQTPSNMMGSIRWIELQLVAFVMVFSAIGLVPLFDLVFPAITTGYLLILSRLAFPGAAKNKENNNNNNNNNNNSNNNNNNIIIIKPSGMLRVYSIIGTVIGLFLPLAYVLGGFARGDNEAVRSATPQLFLLSFQILTENVVSGLSLFSAPVRALVPMLYTVRRLFVILDWIQDVWVHKSLDENAGVQDIAWYWFGMSLAVANLAYFSVNLFAFLIPYFLPRAFEVHFKERYETEAKLAADKSQNETKEKKFD